MIRVCIFLALLSISFADNVKFKDCGKCKLYTKFHSKLYSGNTFYSNLIFMKFQIYKLKNKRFLCTIPVSVHGFPFTSWLKSFDALNQYLK